MAWGSAERAVPSKPSQDTIVRAFKAHLAHWHLPNKVIEAYASTFSHNGEFVLVRTDAVQAEQVMEILRECGARQADRHDNSASQEVDPNVIFDFLLVEVPRNLSADGLGLRGGKAGRLAVYRIAQRGRKGH